MARYLKILILEDVKSDVLLIKYQLKKVKFKYELKIVETINDFQKSIKEFQPDIILSDYFLTDFTGDEALKIAQLLCKNIPFIFVTGQLDDKLAIKFLKKGAWDYVLKDNYVRLVPAIENALKLQKERLKAKIAAKALEDAKNRYKDLYENAPDMYFTVDFETSNIISCNNTLALKTGYQKSEIISNSIFDFYPDLTSTYVKEILIPYLLHNNKVENAEIQIFKKDRSVLHGLININVNVNAKGRIIFANVVIRDISNRKQQTDALKESELRFKTIFNTSEDAILILDFLDKETPTIKDINHKLLSKTGYTKQEIEGKTIQKIIPQISVEEINRSVSKIKNGEKVHEFVKLESSNFVTMYFDVVATLIKISNKDYILVRARDITEEHSGKLKLIKEKEKFEAISEEYNTQNENLHLTISKLAYNRKELKNKLNIINRSPSVSFSWKNDAEWSVDYVSENVEQMFGYTEHDFKSGKIKYKDIIHKDDIERVSNEVDRSLNGENVIQHKSYRIKTKEGEIKWVKDDTIVIKVNDNITHFEGIISDITKIIGQQEQLRLSKNKYKSYIDSSPDMIVITSKTKKIELINQIAEKQFGKNIIGKKCYNAIFGLNDVCQWCTQEKIINKKSYNKEITNPKNNRRYIISTSKIQNEDKTVSYLSSYKDVTSLRKTQSERLKLLKTLEAGLDEIYLFDAITFQFQYVNKRAADNLGYSKKELLKFNPLCLAPELNEAALLNLVEPLKLKKTKNVSFSTTHIRKNGTQYPVDVNLQMIRQAEGDVFLAIVTDISDKIEKEKTIQKLSIAIKQSPITVVITDVKGDIEFVNPKFEETTGYTESEVIGNNPRILKSNLQDKSFYKDMWDTINSGKTWKGEFYNKRKDGTCYWEDATISPIKSPAGKITHFIALKEDTTEKKAIKEKLIKSELHYRKLFENSLIGMYLTTPKGEILRANKAICKMLGYKSFKELSEISLEVDKEQYSKRDEFKNVIEANGQVRGMESVWKTKHGENIYVRESARRYVNEEGNVFYEGTVENITQEKIAAKALKEISEFNKKIIKIGKLGHAIFDIDGNCVSASKSYAELVGATKKQILEQNFYQINNWKIIGIDKKAKECIEKGTIGQAVVDGQLSFKKNVWLEINLSRIYKNNKALLLVIIKDISLFMKAKQRQFQTKAEYVNLIENVNVPIFGINKLGELNEWNNKIQELTAYNRKEIKGKKLEDILIPDKNVEIFEKLINPSIDLELSNLEISLKTKNKGIINLLISTTVRKDINNNVDGIILIGQDVTEIQNSKELLEKKVEERTYDLIQALKKEKELGDMKSQFVSMASHEFRTPLAAISFASGFVKKYWNEIDENKRIVKLDKIETQVKHMTNLLEDVLTFGKTESGKIIFKPKKTNIIDFLKVIIEELENVNSNGQKVVFNFDCKKCYLMLDEKIGRNIFMNLLSNAIKFSPNENSVFLNVESNESEVEIKVIDKGIGIPPNELEHIFTPFHRAQNVNTIQGTGLGLSIVKESIELMKGKIKVESEIGKGTTFTMLFSKTI